MAGGGGFEPPLAESESAVLPLDDPPNSALNEQRYDLGVARQAFFFFDFKVGTGVKVIVMILWRIPSIDPRRTHGDLV